MNNHDNQYHHLNVDFCTANLTLILTHTPKKKNGEFYSAFLTLRETSPKRCKLFETIS